MYKSYIEKHLLVDRYLSDSLDDVEKAAFEERLCWDRELLDEVGLAEQLRDAMRESAATGKLDSDDTRAGLGPAIVNLFAVPQYAAAASFLVAVGLTATVLMNSPGDVRESLNYDGWGAETVLETVSYQLFSVRGSGEQELEIEKNTWTVLEVDAMESCSRYRTMLTRTDNGENSSRRQLTLKPNFHQVLAIGVPTDNLEVGRYELQIEGVEARSGMRCDHREKIDFEITAKH